MIQPQQFPFKLLSFFIATIIILLIAVTWNAYTTNQIISIVDIKDHKLRNAQAKILYYDEILTMSALMAAKTGNNLWIKRYQNYEPKLNNTISAAIDLDDNLKIKQSISSTNDANRVLVGMEQNSFEYVRKGDLQSAWNLLSSDNYKQQKSIYSSGMSKALNLMNEEVEVVNQTKHSQILINLFGSAIVLICTVIIWIIVLCIVKGWQRHHHSYEQEMQKLAFHDILTDLPNKRLLLDRLEQALAQSSRSKSYLAVIYIDLDGFKQINDRYGHHIGDTLLVELANRMNFITRQGDTVSRVGGDEFIIILIGLKKTETLEKFLQRLQNEITTPFAVNRHILGISASLGVSVYAKTSIVEAEELIRQADQAMYIAKKSGKNRFEFFQEH
ncbi:MAG: GGDEF domain-containing protein [Endozoicomonadaceae bacterium]|nr:GGDEF domain-containing protein [Endozoicomonadaceae bacterium]